MLSVVLMFFFFFQAEDGIRDIGVTGVQTCALPIYAVRLVIKCVNADSDPDGFAAMSARAQGHPISIYAGYWPSQELRDLMAACDVYVSLHRSEGLGLTDRKSVV